VVLAAGGGALAAADEDRAVEWLPPDVLAAVCPELALLVPMSADRVRRLAFDGFSGSGFAAICGCPGCVRKVDCSAASCFCAAPALPIAS